MCKLYVVLQEMVFYTVGKNDTEIASLNKRFSRLISRCERYLDSSDVFSYDNCRQSCLMSTVSEETRDLFLNDASQKFHRIFPFQCKACQKQAVLN